MIPENEKRYAQRAMEIDKDPRILADYEAWLREWRETGRGRPVSPILNEKLRAYSEILNSERPESSEMYEKVMNAYSGHTKKSVARH